MLLGNALCLWDVLTTPWNPAVCGCVWAAVHSWPPCCYAVIGSMTVMSFFSSSQKRITVSSEKTYESVFVCVCCHGAICLYLYVFVFVRPPGFSWFSEDCFMVCFLMYLEELAPCCCSGHKGVLVKRGFYTPKNWYWCSVQMSIEYTQTEKNKIPLFQISRNILKVKVMVL